MLDPQKFSEYVWSCDISKATSALTQAEGFVVSILWPLDSATDTEEYDGNGELALLLNRSPVTEITNMKFNGTTVEPSQYFLQKKTGIVRMYTPFPRGFEAVEVTYTAWYTEDTLPSDIKYAIYDIARAYLQAWDSLGSNVKQESIDGASIVWGELDIAKPILVLNSYKKIHV